MNLNKDLTSDYLKGLFFIILVLNVVSISIFIELFEYGQYLLTSTLYFSAFLFCVFLFRDYGIKKDYQKVYYAVIALIFYYLLNHLIQSYSYSFEDLFYIFTVFLFILLMIRLKWTDITLNLISHIAAIFTIIFFVHWIYTGMITNRFEGFVTNPNVSGILFLSILYFLFLGLQKRSLLQRSYFTIIIIINILLIYTTTSRTVYYALIIMFLSWLLLKISKKLFYYLFPLVLLWNAFIVGFYTFLADTKLATTLNEWSKQLFTKNFFSGREEIWSEALPFAMESPLLGYYVNIVPNDYLSFQGMVHVHNQFLQILLESGLIGLLLFIGILYIFWHHYYKSLESYPVQLSACFLIGIIAHQNFGLSLFFHIQSIGLLIWLGIAIGVNRAIQYQQSE